MPNTLQHAMDDSSFCSGYDLTYFQIDSFIYAKNTIVNCGNTIIILILSYLLSIHVLNIWLIPTE